MKISNQKQYDQALERLNNLLDEIGTNQIQQLAQRFHVPIQVFIS